MDNASDIVKDILTQVDFDLSELDLASFTTAKAANTYKIAMALPRTIDDERPTAREAVEMINRSVIGFLTNDGDFKIKFQIYSIGSSQETLDIDRDVIGRARPTETADMASSVVVEYAYSERFYKSIQKTKTDNDAKYLHLNDKSNTIDSVLRLDADAQSLLDDHSTYYGDEFKTENFTVKLQIADLQIGDFITVDGNVLEIQKLNRSISKIGVTARRT